MHPPPLHDFPPRPRRHRRALALLCLAVAALGTEALESRSSHPGTASSTATASGRADASALAADDSASAPGERRGRRRRIPESTRDTYLGDILRERDSTLTRWPDRTAAPVRVWVGGGAGLPGWDARFPELVREAFGDWSASGIPVRFAFVADPAQAEVRVRWVSRLAEESCGETTWTADLQGWMLRADVTLAMRASDGGQQGVRDIKAMALHEVGHLLGLGHAGDTGAIMAPWVAVDALAPADRATVRLLYSLPPGRVARR